MQRVIRITARRKEAGVWCVLPLSTFSVDLFISPDDLPSRQQIRFEIRIVFG